MKNECYPVTRSSSLNVRQHSEKEKIATALVSLCSVDWSYNSIDPLDTISGAINKSVRWEVCITDWNDSCCPRGKNHHKREIPHTLGHTRVQGKGFSCFLPFKGRHFRANLGTVKLGQFLCRKPEIPAYWLQRMSHPNPTLHPSDITGQIVLWQEKHEKMLCSVT